MQIINAADQVSLKSVFAADRAKIVDNIDTILRPARLDHSNHEYRLSAVLGHKTLGYAGVLWLLHDFHHFFVTDEKGKRRAIAFG